MTDPVIIAAFRVRHEAEAAVQALSDARIESEPRRYSEDFERLCLGSFPNGHDVIVSRGDAERAIELLQKLWPDEPQAVPRCPACGSTDIQKIPRASLFVLATAILFVVNIFVAQRDLFLLLIAIIAALLAMTKPLRCRTCGEHLRPTA